MIKPYTDKDYEMLLVWWKQWGLEPVPKECLSDIGVIADDCVVGFLYLTTSALAWVDCLLSDKSVGEIKRSKAVDTIIEVLEGIAKERGKKIAFTTTNKKSIGVRLLDHGYKIGLTNVTQFYKFLGD